MGVWAQSVAPLRTVLVGASLCVLWALWALVASGCGTMGAVVEMCGNADVDSGEFCDLGADKNTGAYGGCNVDCTEGPFCGDGIVDAVEECDDGEGNADDLPDACRTDCTAPACGDGVLDSTEQCDAGLERSDTEPNACRSTCELAHCGDGVLDTGERCDLGSSNSDTAPDACRTNCAPHRCGDGVRDGGEVCDDGDDNSNTVADACRLDCDVARCGDAVTDSGEQCDDGRLNSNTEPNACREGCLAPSCGDGVIDEGEQCDDGDGNSDTEPNACRSDCGRAPCGDGVVDSGEQCDNGDDNSDTAADACRTRCVLARCGDGVRDAGEACDDGYTDACGTCNATCTGAGSAPVCGDGDVCAEQEACDAPGLCTATCDGWVATCDGETAADSDGWFLDVAESDDFVPLCGGQVVIGDRAANAVKLIDVPAEQTLHTYALGAAPGDLELDREGNVLYVALNSAALVRIDLTTGIQESFALDAPAINLALGNDGRLFVLLGDVSVWTDRRLAIIDGTDGQLLAPVEEDFWGDFIVYDRSRDVIIGADAGTSPSSIKRWLYNPSDHSVTLQEDLRSSGSNGQGLVISPDFRHVAFPCGAGNGDVPGYTIHDYSTRDLTVVHGQWHTGAYPRAAAFSADGAKLAASDGSLIMLFDVSTHALEQTWEVGFGNCGYSQLSVMGVSGGGHYIFAYTDCGIDEATGRIYWRAVDLLCGNGRLDAAEVCDDGYRDACGSCNETCTGPGTGSVCGDGEVCAETERCDDPTHCTGDCQSPVLVCRGSVEPTVSKSYYASGPTSDFVPLCGDLALLGDKDDHEVRLVRALQGQVVARYPLPARPGDLELDVARGKLYVATRGTQIVEVELSTGDQRSIAVSDFPLGLALGPTGRLFALLNDLHEWPSRPLAIVDTVSAEVLTEAVEDLRAGAIVYDDVHDQVIFGNPLSRWAYDATTDALSLTEQTAFTRSNENQLSISPDGEHLACSDVSAILHYGTTDLGTLLGQWDPDGADSQQAVQFSADGAHLASAESGRLLLFAMDDHTLAHQWSPSFEGCSYSGLERVGTSTDGRVVYGYTDCGFDDEGGRLYWMVVGE